MDEFEKLFKNLDKWNSLCYKLIRKELLFEMKEIIDNIISSLIDIQFKDDVFLLLLNSNNNQLISMLSNDIDEKEVNDLYETVVNILYTHISEEEIINEKRKNNLNKIL